jgi:hypothetical protein
MTALRPGTVAWRIGRSGPLRCEIMTTVRTLVCVRPSRFSRASMLLPVEDVFPDRAGCRAEIQRRANGTEETTP